MRGMSLQGNLLPPFNSPGGRGEWDWMLTHIPMYKRSSQNNTTITSSAQHEVQASEVDLTCLHGLVDVQRHPVRHSAEDGA